MKEFILSVVLDGYAVMFWEREEKDLVFIDSYGYLYFQKFGTKDLLPITIYSNMDTIECLVDEFIEEGFNWEVV